MIKNVHENVLDFFFFCVIVKAAKQKERIMRTLNCTTMRRELAKTIDEVCLNSEPVIVTKGSKRSVVVVSLEDYSSLIETDYLLRNPNNAAWLRNSVAAVNAGKVTNIAVEESDKNGALHNFLFGAGKSGH